MVNLGIDVGNKTIGLAVSDELEILSSPIETIYFNDKDFTSAILKLKVVLKDYDVARVVIGLPLNADGSDSEQTRIVRHFAELLKKEVLKLLIVFQDERYSTQAATSLMREQNVSNKKMKSRKDSVAASIILTEYLNSNKRK